MPILLTDQTTIFTFSLQTLDECFQEIKACSSSRRTWLATRKAFVDSAIKTNQVNGLGFNLNKCKLDPGQDPDEKDNEKNNKDKKKVLSKE